MKQYFLFLIEHLPILLIFYDFFNNCLVYKSISFNNYYHYFWGFNHNKSGEGGENVSYMQNQGNQNQSPYQIAARGYNPQQNLEVAAEMGQKTQGEISRILASKSVTGIEFGYLGNRQNNEQMNNQMSNSQMNNMNLSNQNNNQNQFRS